MTGLWASSWSSPMVNMAGHVLCRSGPTKCWFLLSKILNISQSLRWTAGHRRVTASAIRTGRGRCGTAWGLVGTLPGNTLDSSSPSRCAAGAGGSAGVACCQGVGGLCMWAERRTCTGPCHPGAWTPPGTGGVPGPAGDPTSGAPATCSQASMGLLPGGLLLHPISLLAACS